MILLLTTPLGVYAYDVDTQRLCLVACGDSEYGGITWDQDQIYLSHSKIDNASLQHERDYRNAAIGVVQSYSRCAARTVADELSQPHQILMDSRGRLLIANTGLNRIDIVHRDRTTVKKHLNEVTCDVVGQEKLGDHFNGFFEDGGVLFVVSHNNGRRSKIWELEASSLELRTIHQTQALWAHNCWLCEHGLVICDSKNGSLYDVYSGETLWKPELPFISRGLAATQDYIFVGHSEFGDRRSRRYSAGGFWVIDRKTLKTLDNFMFPGTGCTIELRILDKFDFCHKAPPRDPAALDDIRRRSLRSTIKDKVDRYRYRLFG